MPHPIRVLQIVYSLGVGGIESWLINLLRERPDDILFDFLVYEPGGRFEQEVRDAGSNIFYVPPPNFFHKVFQFANSHIQENRLLKGIFAQRRYDVVHIHSYLTAGPQVKIAAACGIPKRIVHVHTCQFSESLRGFGVKQFLRHVLFKKINAPLIEEYATDVLCCSRKAVSFFIQEGVPKSKPFYCGLSDIPFLDALKTGSRSEICTLYGIPKDAVVIGNAGRMGTVVKNHFFMIDIFKVLFERDSRFWLFLAGDGNLRSQIIKYAEQRGVASRVVIPGNCEIAPLMTNVFDLHLFPSRNEGLGLAIVEAAASGLFTLCSDAIPNDVTDAFPDRISILPLSAPASTWADEAERCIGRKIPVQDGCRLLRVSPFAIKTSLESLRRIYKANSLE